MTIDKANDTPLVSVITVVYNGEDSIEETIQSVINQTYENIEYIIVDGGSTDKTVDIIEKYDEEVDYWVSEPDEGIYDAMNKGITSSTGNLIALLNSGDLFMHRAVEGAVNSTHNVEDKIIAGNLYKYKPLIFGNINIPVRLNKKHFGNNSDFEMPFFHPATFVGKNVYKKIGLYSLKYDISSDYDFSLRAQSYNIEFVFKDAFFTRMLMGGVSQRLESLEKRIYEMFRIRKEHGASIWINIKISSYFILDEVKRLTIKKIVPKKILSHYYEKKSVNLFK